MINSRCTSLAKTFLFASLLQYSCLENLVGGGAWWATVRGVAKSRTRLSDFTFTLHFHAVEKEMETHSSVLALRIPGTGKPGWAAVYGVAQSRTQLKRLSSSSSSSFGERNGNPLQCSCLENPRDGEAWLGCCLWGSTELDTTEAT